MQHLRYFTRFALDLWGKWEPFPKKPPFCSIMKNRKNRSLSKFLSLVLRHEPETAGIILDERGWTDLDELLAALNRQQRDVTEADIVEVVRTNDKQRFALDLERRRIRANQGHSVRIDPDLPALEPPELLYHGTAQRFLEPIQREGLRAMSRIHVHLSADRETASKVGKRHGRLVILIVRAGELYRAGTRFYRSENGVWLTDAVPAEFIFFPDP